MKNLYVIGVGLIGGSLALDIKKNNPDITVFGIDSNQEHLSQAESLNVIDKSAGYKDLSHADLVIVSIPVDATVKHISEILNENYSFIYNYYFVWKCKILTFF